MTNIFKINSGTHADQLTGLYEREEDRRCPGAPFEVHTVPDFAARVRPLVRRFDQAIGWAAFETCAVEEYMWIRELETANGELTKFGEAPRPEIIFLRLWRGCCVKIR